MDPQQPLPSSSIVPISDKPDDLFICSAGIDEVCMNVARNAFMKSIDDERYKADLSLILRYRYKEEYKETPARDYLEWLSYEEDHFAKKLDEIVSSSRGMVKKSDILLGYPQVNFHIFKNVFEKEISLEKTINNITVDISSINDEDLIPLLYHLDKPNNNVRLFYSEPSKGRPPKSEGIFNSGWVPPFLSPPSIKKDVVVAFCGYEPGRVSVFRDKVRPHKLILSFPKPSFHKNWDLLSMKAHNCFRHMFEWMDISGVDPLAVKGTLERIYNSYPISDENVGNRWSMGIALFGTKWQTVGAYLFARDKKEKCRDIGAYFFPKGKKKEPESLEYCPVTVYYQTPLFSRLLESYDSVISQFMLPRKEVRV